MLNISSARKLARVLADNVGLNVVFEDEAKPRTNGRNVYVQNPDPMWNDNQWTTWWSHLYHEVGHNDPAMRDCFTLAKDKKIGMDSFFGSGINLIDDHRQERHNLGMYLGRDNALAGGHKLTMDDIISSGLIGKGEDKHRDAMEAALAYDTYCREAWMPSTIGMYNMLYD